MEEEKKVVEMNSEELRQFEAFKAKQAAENAKVKAKQDRDAYALELQRVAMVTLIVIL